MTIKEIKHHVTLLSKTYRESVDDYNVPSYFYDYKVQLISSEDVFFFCIEERDLYNDFNDNDWEFITYYFNNKDD